VRFLEILAREALAAHTPWLLVALVVVNVLVRRLPRLQRPRKRTAITLFAIHVVLLGVVAGAELLRYDAKVARLAALAFFLFCALGLAGTALFRLVMPAIGMPVPRIMVDIITAIAVIVVVIVVGKSAGFSVAGLITTSAVLTAVIGFAMQDTLGNMMGGLALQLDNSVQVGDWVMLGVGQPAGKVTEIRWRYTAIETRNWETIVVPNSVLMKSSIMVLGKRSVPTRMVRRMVEFFVDFRTPPNDVITAVQDAIRADPPRRTATDPPPQVLFQGVRDSYASYVILYWVTELESDFGPDSDIRVRMYYALRRAGIQLSIPAQALFITQESSERESRKETEEVDRRLSVIDRVDLFRPIQGDLRKHLATALTFAPFAQGEVMAREDTVGDDALYVIVSGQASVRLGGATGRQVALLGPGHFFGEMSMMTGERRSATVIAVSDLACYRLDKSAFERVLREHPDVAEEVAEILAERREELAAAKDELEDVRRRRLQTEKENLLGRIRGFFNLFDGD
jgi:small-conductance mechanosensitive channel/CRP-like cAMP-binding protein